jgi:hypothetical protein
MHRCDILWNIEIHIFDILGFRKYRDSKFLDLWKGRTIENNKYWNSNFWYFTILKNTGFRNVEKSRCREISKFIFFIFYDFGKYRDSKFWDLWKCQNFENNKYWNSNLWFWKIQNLEMLKSIDVVKSRNSDFWYFTISKNSGIRIFEIYENVEISKTTNIEIRTFEIVWFWKILNFEHLRNIAFAKSRNSYFWYFTISKNIGIRNCEIYENVERSKTLPRFLYFVNFWIWFCQKITISTFQTPQGDTTSNFRTTEQQELCTIDRHMFSPYPPSM